MKMKRICLFLALVLLAALTFSAFAQEDGSTPTEPAVILRSNPTTGYTWTATVADEKVVAVVDDGFAQDAAEETATGVAASSATFLKEKRRDAPPSPLHMAAPGRRRPPCTRWCTTLP